MTYIAMIGFLLIAQCDLYNHQFGADNPLERMKRDTAAPPIKSKAAVVVEQHMKLARILNAIYLQIQLTNNKIDDFDVIAGIWEIDRSAIEKLVSLKVEALDGSLNSLEQIVNEFPNDLRRIANVEEISKNLDSVKEITPEKREALRLAVENNLAPRFLKNAFPEWNFRDNLADIALQELETVKNMTVFAKEKMEKLAAAISAISTELRTMEVFIDSVNEEQQKTIETFVQGYKTAIEVKKKVKEIQELTTLLTETGKSLVSIQSLRNIEGISTLHVESTELKTSLLRLHQNSNMSVAPAFSSNYDVATLKTSLKDTQIVSLISGGKDLSSLESYLGDIESTAKTFTPVNQNMKTLMNYNLIDQLVLISRSFVEVSAFQQNSNQFNLTSLPSCNESSDLTDEISLAELEPLSTNLTNFLKVVPSIAQNFSEASNIRGKFNGLMDKVLDVTEKKFKSWLNSTEFENIEKILKNASSVFVKIIQSPEIADGIVRLSAGKGKILSVEEKLKKFTASNKECDTLFTFDIEPFKAFNDLPDTIQRIKKEKTIQLIKPLIGIVPKLAEDLGRLKRTKSRATTVAPVTKTKTHASSKAPKGSQKPKRSTDDGKKFECQNPQDLLDVATSVRGLEIMDLIFQYSNLIDTVIKQGTLAENSIATIKNPSNKAELEKIWKDFGLMKTTLEAVKSNNQKLVDTVTSSGQEKSLEDVGLVYRNLASLNPSERVFLRDLRLSMRLFEQQNKELMESLEKLEKPLATDWQMTHASFKRVPTAMQNLKKDFDKFFEVETTFSPTEYSMDNELDYMQYQDSRFEINKRNDNGHTKLYDAYMDGNYEEMYRLVNEGAIIDATNGDKHRTVLMEAVIANDLFHCNFLLEAHAYIDNIWDYNSKGVREHADGRECEPIKDHWTKEREGFVRCRILPNAPRPWKILVLKKGSFPGWKIKRLPHRIKACTKWGWTGEDLNQYTTIILPWKYIKGKKEKDNEVLMMDDSEDLLKWKLVGCSASLLNVQFLERLYDAWGWVEEVHEVLQTDNDNCVMSMEYKGQLHTNAVWNHKNAIHQMQPLLLTDVKITLLKTENKKTMNQQKAWKDVIKLFGGKLVERPNFDEEFHEYPPYHSAYPDYPVEEGIRPTRNWILTDKDTEVRRLRRYLLTIFLRVKRMDRRMGQIHMRGFRVSSRVHR
uniref:ANK_REP_REGION domain-containing protein n=1 Tax=Caenorhabditis tropicalis TaxID=1561998 RepID=A0A1I7UDX3_9PELO